MSFETAPTSPCYCHSLADMAVVPMGGDDLDERVFATLDLIKNHGGQRWWLYVSACNACGQNWMVAQDERIHDNYCLKRISSMTFHEIVEHSRWPDDFLRYEDVLRYERDAGSVAQFVDPQSPALAYTVVELLSERPGISLQEIAYVLAVSPEDAKKLLPQ